MSRVIWFVLAVAAAGACSKADEGLKSLQGVQGAVCGCKPTDYECATQGLAKIATWGEKYAGVEGARSQAAKATALVEGIDGCQADQVLASLPERAGCAKLDKDAKAKERWCKVEGWGGAKAVEAKDLPFGATLVGEVVVATVGAPPPAPAAARVTIGGTAEAPTADDAPIEAKGKGWKWTRDGATTELRKIEGGWMGLTIDGDTHRIAVFDAP